VASIARAPGAGKDLLTIQFAEKFNELARIAARNFR
jgi:hypothetical protein